MTTVAAPSAMNNTVGEIFLPLALICFPPLLHVKHVRRVLWVLVGLLPPHLGRRLADVSCAVVAARACRPCGDHA
jgi:hypothetical protein